MPMNQKTENLLPLATSIGEFIRYWGFRRVHGQIWTLVYLCTDPLSGIELANALKVSKALVSPALKELEDYKLIYQVEAENDRTKRYRANPDVFGVIQQVLISREMVILHQVNSQYDLLERQQAQADDKNLNMTRMSELGDMVRSANAFINKVSQVDSSRSLRLLAKIISRTSKLA